MKYRCSLWRECPRPRCKHYRPHEARFDNPGNLGCYQWTQECFAFPADEDPREVKCLPVPGTEE